MLQAELTCPGPNHTAANLAGTLNIKTWLSAANVCPINVTANKFGATEKTFIQAPKHVPNEPIIVVKRKPYKYKY